jgi:L-ascorbate metabolism protein UlaG (beta-lactamase superfamily)
MKVRLIRNATLRIEYAGQVILFDPYLAAKGQGRSYLGRDASPLVDLPDQPDQIIAGIDAVLVSHLHSDHFDTVAKTLIPKETPVLCRQRDSAAIGEAGFRSRLDIEPRLLWNNISFSATEGRHGPDEVLAELGEVSGFVLQSECEPTLYLTGDTIWCPAVEAALERFKPDVVVVHAAGATWRGAGPIVMDVDQVYRVIASAPQAMVLATHLDCVDHATVDRIALSSAAATWNTVEALQLLIPLDGQTMEFDRGSNGIADRRRMLLQNSRQPFSVFLPGTTAIAQNKT